MNLNNKKIVYTGDTCTLEPFREILKDADEFYVDVSKNGGVHLKITDILEELEKIKANGTKVFLMHIDDREYMNKIVENKFIVL